MLYTELQLIAAGSQLCLDFRCATELLASRPAALELLLLVRQVAFNACRHGQATVLRFKLAWDHRDLRLSMEDNGAGYELDDATRGQVLASIRDSTRTLRGALTVDSTPGKGTTIAVTAPISSFGIPTGENR